MQDKKAKLKTFSNENRIEKWDILRALLIYFVVLGHMADQYTAESVPMKGLFLFIYTFHMPCFLFLDGLFSKRNINEKRYSHIFSYLILYLFVLILNSLVKGIIYHEITFSLLNSDGTHWYGLCLFNCCLITIFLKQFSKKWVLIGSIILACFTGYDSSIGDYLVLSRTIVFFPFFFLGYCLDPQELADRLSSIWKQVCGLVIIMAFAFICFNYTDNIYFMRALLTGRNSYHSLSSAYGLSNLVYYGSLLRLGYYLIVYILCMALIAITPRHLPKGKWIVSIGEHSLQIYVLHIELIHILYSAFHFKDLCTANNINCFIIVPVAFIITILLSLPLWEKPIKNIIYPLRIN